MGCWRGHQGQGARGASCGAKVKPLGAKDDIWGFVMIKKSNHSVQWGIGNLECKSGGIECSSSGMGCHSGDMGCQSSDWQCWIGVLGCWISDLGCWSGNLGY